MTAAPAKGGRRAILPTADLTPPVATPFGRVDAPNCRDVDPEMFFDDGRILQALAACAACPIRRACLDYALENEEFGVWGGTTPDVRTALREGQPVAATPEDRHLVWWIHDRIDRGDNMAEIAARIGVTERTLYRWTARMTVNRVAA